MLKASTAEKVWYIFCLWISKAAKLARVSIPHITISSLKSLLIPPPSPQLHAQVSYMKEDQENLRQSVKAIAVSVSNTIDRAEMDRLDMQRINESITQLKSHSKQHFYRLNDHILKVCGAFGCFGTRI